MTAARRYRRAAGVLAVLVAAAPAHAGWPGTAREAFAQGFPAPFQATARATAPGFGAATQPSSWGAAATQPSSWGAAVTQPSSWGAATPGSVWGAAATPDPLLGGPALLLRPAFLDLSAGALPLELWVEGAPPTTGFEALVSFDSAVAAVTAIEDGGFLSASGAATSFEPAFDAPGRLRLYATASLSDTLSAPSGSGLLARITLAPLAQGGPTAVEVTEARLWDGSGGATAVERTVGGQLVVTVPPSPDAAAEAAAQASSLARALGTGSGGALGDLDGYRSELLWLVVLAAGLALVFVGWLLGRRPTVRAYGPSAPARRRLWPRRRSPL